MPASRQPPVVPRGMPSLPQLPSVPRGRYNTDFHSDAHFDFFRQRIAGKGGSDNINATLERVLLFLMEAAGVPVLLSLLVLVFSAAGDDGDLDMLPQVRDLPGSPHLSPDLPEDRPHLVAPTPRGRGDARALAALPAVSGLAVFSGGRRTGLVGGRGSRQMACSATQPPSYVLNKQILFCEFVLVVVSLDV